MHRIDCPWCGKRDQTEFQYSGDATVLRPPAEAKQDDFFDYVYIRDNPKGWHTEWWHHTGGCRMWVKVVRNTLTHEIHMAGMPQSKPGLPRQKTARKKAAKKVTKKSDGSKA